MTDGVEFEYHAYQCICSQSIAQLVTYALTLVVVSRADVEKQFSFNRPQTYWDHKTVLNVRVCACLPASPSACVSMRAYVRACECMC